MKPRRCVDAQGRVIEERYCEADQRDLGYGRPGYIYIHHWYYGGNPGWIPYGRPIFGGSYVRPMYGDFYAPTMRMQPDITVYSTDSAVVSGGTTVTRGVFGSSAEGFSAHGGGGGGE